MPVKKSPNGPPLTGTAAARATKGESTSDGALNREVFRMIFESATLPELFNNVSQLVSRHSECLGLWIVSPGNKDGAPLQYRALVDREDNPLFPLLKNTFDQYAPQILNQPESCVVPMSAEQQAMIAFVPIAESRKSNLLLIGCFCTKNQTETRHLWLLTIVGTAIAAWSKERQIDMLRIRTFGSSQAIAAAAAFAKCKTFDSIAIAAANQMKMILGASRLFLAIKASPAQKCKLAAISDLESFDRMSPAAIEAQQIIDHQESATEIKRIDRSLASTLPEPLNHAVTSLLDSSVCTDCLTVPLAVEGQVVGHAIALINSENAPAVDVNFLAEQFKFLAPQLDLALRANDSILRLTFRRTIGFFKKDVIKKIGIGCLIALAIVLCPMPYRIACDTKVQPVSRRFITAPFEAILTSTVAKSGDIVAAGDLLARLDGQNLRFQLSGMQAELRSAEKKRDQALAQKDIAESQIQKSETNRILSEIQSIEKRLQELDIRSPISGMIVSGDLDQVEGAKLQIGQTLFEIGPLDEMLVEIQVPEDLVRFVKPGQQTKVKFNAYPFRNWTGTIKKVHPRSEIIDGENSFIAEVSIENKSGELQPGMRGSAKISNGWSCVGWVYLHRAWDDIRYWFVW